MAGEASWGDGPEAVDTKYFITKKNKASAITESQGKQP